MSLVYVRAVLGNELRSIQIDSNLDLLEVFKAIIKEHPNDFPNLKNCKTGNLAFQKLKVPVLIDNSSDEAFENTIKTCHKEENWEKVHPTVLVRDITPKWESTLVYVIIALDDKQKIAIRKLKRKYPDIYKRLQVNVESITSWNARDVELSGGIPTSKDSVSEIVQRLQQKRTYHEDENDSRLVSAKEHRVAFDQMFTEIPASVSATVHDCIEYMALDVVAKCYTAYASCHIVGPKASSAVKASSFKVPFMHFPFLACSDQRSFEYNEEVSWRFPIFLTQYPDEFGRYTPNSDFNIISPDFLCPFLIAEVVSNKEESNRHRMLVQGIAAVRVGQYLMKPNGRKFIVFAIHIDSKLIAHRYILYETDNCMPNSELRYVGIIEEEFDLTDQVRAASFLLEMFNLIEIIKGLAGDLDQEKKGKEYLKNVNKDANNIRSLHSNQRPKNPAADPKNNTTPLGSIKEGCEDDSTLYSEDSQSLDSEGGQSFDSEDSHPFDSERVNAVLESRGYRIQYEVAGHPHIVVVSEHDKPDISGYLKFVEDTGDEADILKYLAKFNSPMNHTIRPVEVWQAPGGFIISMPVGGEPLIELQNPSKHLWPALQQVFEAIQFMHDHGIAHMDIKPQNILIPVNYGRLVIIDFSLAVRVDNDNWQGKFTDLVGTRGYIAPEVSKSKRSYNPIRADLWSCGKVVEELCLRCGPSPTRKRLFEVSRLLMNDDPMRRPMMRDVLEMMSLREDSSTIGKAISRTDVRGPSNMDNFK